MIRITLRVSNQLRQEETAREDATPAHQILRRGNVLGMLMDQRAVVTGTG